MKIILCLHQFFPVFYTGTETLVLDVAHGLVKEGHDVVILTAEPQLNSSEILKIPSVKEDVYEGLKILRVNIPESSDQVERLVRESEDFMLTDLFDKILKAESPDIVHIFHLMRLTSKLVSVAKNNKIHLFFTPTDFWMLCPSYQLIKYNNKLCDCPSANDCFSCILSLYLQGMEKNSYKFSAAIRFPILAKLVNNQAKIIQNILYNRILIHRKVIAEFDCVFWPNNFIRGMFYKNSFIPQSDLIVPFPIPEKAKNLFDLKAVEVEKCLHVGFIGTIRESKGPQILIQAMQYVPKRYPIKVFIYGSSLDDKFIAEIEVLASKDERICMKGIFPQENFGDILEKLQVVVIPSTWYENTPLTALSVLAAKRVLVVSDLGGLASLVKNTENGFSFPANDYKQLANILIELATDHNIVKNIVNQIQVPIRTHQYIDKLLTKYTKYIK